MIYRDILYIDYTCFKGYKLSQWKIQRMKPNSRLKANFLRQKLFLFVPFLAEFLLINIHY